MPSRTATQESNSASILHEYRDEIKNQSIHPPGNDIVIQTCYQAFLNELQDASVAQNFADIIAFREFTPAHFANILFRSIQYIELYHRGKNNYPVGYDTTEIWRSELHSILTTQFELLKTLLLSKDTTTTIYQRYAGSKILLNAIFPNKPLAVADLGCGGNYGLPGLIKNKQFENIIDHTNNQRVSQLLTKKTDIISALAIDKENPYKNEAKQWRFSCSFYPHELQKTTEMILPNGDESETIFTRIDLTEAENDPTSMGISPHSFDAVIMSTFLYQLKESQIDIVMNFAKKIVKEEGIIIIQDFAEKSKSDPEKIKLISNWFSMPFPYRTFITGSLTGDTIKEILLWGNGRCREVSEGLDFEFIFSR